jgi:hypothetical protein
VKAKQSQACASQLRSEASSSSSPLSLLPSPPLPSPPSSPPGKGGTKKKKNRTRTAARNATRARRDGTPSRSGVARIFHELPRVLASEARRRRGVRRGGSDPGGGEGRQIWQAPRWGCGRGGGRGAGRTARRREVGRTAAGSGPGAGGCSRPWRSRGPRPSACSSPPYCSPASASRSSRSPSRRCGRLLSLHHPPPVATSGLRVGFGVCLPCRGVGAGNLPHVCGHHGARTLVNLHCLCR